MMNCFGLLLCFLPRISLSQNIILEYFLWISWHTPAINRLASCSSSRQLNGYLPDPVPASPRAGAAGNSSNFASTNAAQKYDEIMPENNSCDYSNVQKQPQLGMRPIGPTSNGFDWKTPRTKFRKSLGSAVPDKHWKNIVKCYKLISIWKIKIKIKKIQ